MRTSQVKDIDGGLLTWFKQSRAQGASISRPILMEKAGELAKELGISFVSCSAWLGRFKRRHGIVFKAVSGEAASVNMTTVDKWRDSADETGFFFKCPPDKTLDFKRALCTGGKKAKDCLTVLVAVVMSGTEKTTPLCNRQNCQALMFQQHQATDYHANKKAWMTIDLFVQWLKS
ncbi:tigger transposable element-derived protein [Elysia marginata]|uniref:Tigger transposable element-derived protein n=1 Tax=Elysia marginata TaxID=1093978 RepID=A0AAV4FG11_9GAST|nr:tigger transposable element-derived protein [Elysia marginata]